MAEDYYSLLGVERRASREAITRAFRDQVKLVHPDNHPDDALAADRTRQLVEAYKTLRNPASKRNYDSHLAANAPLFRPDFFVNPTLSPLVSRIIAVAIFVLVGMLAGVIVGAFTDGGHPSTLAVLPSTSDLVGQTCLSQNVEACVWNSVEWHWARLCPLGPADTGVDSQSGDTHAKAVRPISASEPPATSWLRFVQAGAREI